jgi:hypothetical protein
MNGEVALRVEVVPPLSQGTAWIELLAAGQSAQNPRHGAASLAVTLVLAVPRWP